MEESARRQAALQPCLIVLRGNSASGKSTVAAEVRAQYGRGIAIVGQDNLRRVVLRERDVADGVNISLIEHVTRFALTAGYHTIVEGILYSAHYGPMLGRLADSHPGPSWFYYFDVPFAETLRRHAGKPQAAEYGAAEMSQWYRDKDLLPDGIEEIIPADSSLELTVGRIMNDSGLAASPATAPHETAERRLHPAQRPRAAQAPMWERIGQLHRHHADVPPEIRLLKLSEEVGEAAEAYIGMTGMNSRKGVCRSQDDVLDELADVIITAGVAMSGLAGSVDNAADHFQQRLRAVLARADLR